MSTKTDDIRRKCRSIIESIGELNPTGDGLENQVRAACPYFRSSYAYQIYREEVADFMANRRAVVSAKDEQDRAASLFQNKQ